MSSGENEWDDYAEGWDDDVAVQAYAEAAFGMLLNVLARHGISLQGAEVLDFGCGTGTLTERVAAHGAVVQAVDTSTAMLGVLEDKVANAGLSGVSTSLVIPAASSFDFVLCSSVCAFLDDYPGTVRELVSLLRPGGIFIQWDWEWKEDDAEPFGLSRSVIRATLTEVGLGDVVVDTAFSVSIEGHEMAPVIGHGVLRGDNTA